MALGYFGLFRFICWSLWLITCGSSRASLILEDSELSEQCRKALTKEKALQQKLWHQLLDSEREAFRAIGYDRDSWNDFERQPDELKPWRNLSRHVQALLENVGYGEDLWECDVIAELQLPERFAAPQVNNSPLAHRYPISLESGDDELTVGYFAFSLSSTILASIVGRLFAGVYDLKIKTIPLSYKERHSQVDNGTVDIIVDDFHNKQRSTSGLSRVYDYGWLAYKITYFLYMTVPKDKTQACYDDFTSLIPYWTLLNNDKFFKWLPAKRCPDRRLLGENWTGLGIWCPPHIQADSERVPLIWATGPQFSSNELHGFLHANKLVYGIEYLHVDDLFQRAEKAAKFGVPALIWIREPSFVVTTLYPYGIKRIDMPHMRKCGHLGNRTHVKEWWCAARRQHISKIGSQVVENSVLVRQVMQKMDFTDRGVFALYSLFNDIYYRDGARCTACAVTQTADAWISTNEKQWNRWFSPPPELSTSGRIQIVGVFGIALVFYFIAEMMRRPRGEFPKQVDVKLPINAKMELFAGTTSTLSILMDSVGMAAIICSTTRLNGHMGIFFLHVLVGQTLGQFWTVVFSRYETPICTPSVEILPFIKILVTATEAATVGQAAEHVIGTVLVASTLISLSSGLLMFALGYFGLSGVLQYIPYSVKTGIQGGMGIVLLAVGLELSCDSNFLDLTTEEDFVEFFSGGVIILWIPAFVAGLLLFSISEFITDSPYTNLCFMALAIPSFHLFRYLHGLDMSDALEAGWLFPHIPTISPMGFWRALRPENICWEVLFSHFPTILIASLVGPILNCVSDLAVVKSVLPPNIMGSSDFDHEILVQGRSHILLGLVGGFSTDYGNDDTVVHRMFGGKRRLSMWAHSITLALCIVFPYAAAITPYVPKFVNGAVIALAGFGFLYAALVNSYSELVLSEYFVVVLFVLVCVMTHGSIETAVLVGTFFGFSDFVVRYAMTDQVKFPACKSATAWGANERFRLETCGLRKNIVTAKLSGYIFFASAPELVSSLLVEWEKLLKRGPPHQKLLIVDWKAVTGVDTAAVLEFERLTEAGQERSSDCLVIFSGMNSRVESGFRHEDFITPVPDFLKQAWPSQSQYLSREDVRSILQRLDIPGNHVRELGARLGASISIDIFSAIVNHYVSNEAFVHPSTATSSLGSDWAMRVKATMEASNVRASRASRLVSDVSFPSRYRSSKACRLNSSDTLSWRSGVHVVSPHKPKGDDTEGIQMRDLLNRKGMGGLHVDRDIARLVEDDIGFTGDKSVASLEGFKSLGIDIGTDETETENEGYYIVAVPTLDDALYFAEVMQLKVHSSRSDNLLTDSFFHVFGQVPFRAFQRFKALAVGLWHKSSVTPLLRALVTKGKARLLSFHDDEVIHEPDQLAECFYVLLAGCVVAFWPHDPVLFRHVSCHDIFCEESLFGAHSGIGHKASSSCVILAVNPRDISAEDQASVFQKLAVQSQALKTLVEHDG